MSYVGKLERKGMLRFLKKVESQSRNGLLTIKNGDRRVELYFQRGECISVFDSSMQDAAADRRLLEEIVAQDIERRVPKTKPIYGARPVSGTRPVYGAQARRGSMRARLQDDGDVAHMLVDQGYVTREQIDAWIMRRAGQILQQIFTWSKCEVFFADSVTPPAERLLMTHDRRSLIDALFVAGKPVISPRHLSRDTIKLAEVSQGDTTVHALPKTNVGQRLPASQRPAATTASPRTTRPIPLVTPPESSGGLGNRSQSGIHGTLPMSQAGMRSQSGIHGALPVSQAGMHSQSGVYTAFPASQPGTSGSMTAVTAPHLLRLSDMITTAKIAVVKQRERARLSWEIVLVVLLLAAVGVAHGWNMFHFPYIEDDEGTYMFQASAVVHIGKLAYYTYWYDHAPLGWLQIALWSVLTGGFHIFGSVIYSGRVMMLALQVLSTLLVYLIGRSISKGMFLPLAAAALFAFSPYGLYYHRRILLDNIATFWMLLSIFWLVRGRPSLRNYWFSAVALGISVLSKEVTVFIAPVLLGMIYWRADRSHRMIALVGWLLLFASVVSLYPLMAALKNELLPAGVFLNDHSQHVSMLDSLFFQSQRAHDGGITNAHSTVRSQLHEWLVDDPLLCAGGMIGAALSLFFWRKRPTYTFFGLMTLALASFLLRNGLVLDFYLLPMLPLLALSLALGLESLLDLIWPYWLRLLYRVDHLKLNIRVARACEQVILCALVLSVQLSLICFSHDLGFHGPYLSSEVNPWLYWNGTQANTQQRATVWIERHLPHNSRLVIDESMGPDLYDSGYKLSHYYWRIAEDPAIGQLVFHDNWRNFDYIVTTPQMMDDVQQNNMRLIQDGVRHSIIVAQFRDGHYIVDVRQVNKR